MELRRYRLTLPTARVFRISQGERSSVETVVCEISHEGATGRGEAAPSTRVTGEDASSVEAFLDRFAPELRFIDAAAIPKFLDRVHEEAPANPAARCALDVALHDLAGKLEGRTAREFYALAPGRIETSATVSFDEPAAMAAEALDWWARGYRCLKLKLGEARQDLERVSAVRRAVPHAALRADANAGWTYEQAYALLRRLGDFRVELVEQPVKADELDSLAGLSRESPIPVYADESALDVNAQRKLAQKGFRGGFNVKLQKAGGIRPALVALKDARARAYGTQLGCNVESGLGIGAACQLLSLLDYADLDGNVLLARDPFRGPRPVRGWLTSPERPGIGVELDGKR